MRFLPLILICVCFGILGQLSLKQGMTQVGAVSFSRLLVMLFKAFTNPYVVGGFLFYGFSSILWLVILSRVPLSYAYPMISISYIIVVLLSGILFRETIPLIRWIGVILVSVGVTLIAQS